MLDWIAYILVLGLNKAFSVIPISWSLWFGRRIGSIAFMINKKRRLVAYANLRAAFAAEKSPRELRRITKRVYQNMVQTFVEIMNLTKINKAYVDKYIEVVNFERIANASKAGRGTILLTAHFGDWELSSLVSSVKGFPIMVLAREQKMKRLNGLLNRLRESNGCKVVEKGFSTKHLIRALRANNIVGILSDQDAGRKGMFVDFFGRPTSSHSGPMEIASHTDSLILPNFIVRTGGPYHKLYLEEYIDFRTMQSPDAIRDALQRFSHLLESYIRKYPDQWLWLHKRWKSTPIRTVLILSDGKAGHCNQSRAVAAEIARARASQRYALSDTHIVEAEVRYKSKFRRAVLGSIAPFISWRMHGHTGLMRWALTRESYEPLMRIHAEFIVSCGSGAAPVNICMSIENDAKNVVIMKPNMPFSWRAFKLAIVPAHDRPPKRKNIVTTLMAPNCIDRDAIAAAGDRLRSRVGLPAGPVISVFIGGNNPEFAMTRECIERVIDGLLAAADCAGAAILVTTSRRTPQAVEALLRERLSRHPRCAGLVIANQSNPPDTVAEMLGACSVAVVSEESISMVSEAASSGRPVVIFKLQRRQRAQSKHERALAFLAERGVVKVADSGEIAACVGHALGGAGSAPNVASDREAIFNAVRALI